MDDKIEKLNKIRIAGHMSDEDSSTLGNAISMFQYNVINLLYEKYCSEKVIETPIIEARAEIVPYVVEPKQEETKPTRSDVELFNKIRKTLKHEILRDEVMDEHKNTCALCKHKFPTREQFKKDHPKTTYPLFIRCDFKIPEYLNKNRIMTLDEGLKDKEIFNKENYKPICTDCKPSRFVKKRL